jgi:hypothetical protein
MLDDALDSLLCAFDWLLLPLAFLQDLFAGPRADFGVRAGAGWTRLDVARLLSAHGVHAWGVRYSREMIMFTVREAQARPAYSLLQREGLPVLYAPRRLLAASGAGRAGARAGGALDPVFGLLDRLDGDGL